MNRFIEKMTLARLDGSYIKLLNHLERQGLIILDDFGLQPLTQDLRLALLQILEDRYGRKSVIVISQLPVSKWMNSMQFFSLNNRYITCQFLSPFHKIDYIVVSSTG